MTTDFLVIAGCLGIKIERWWKRLFEDQWYFMESRFVNPVEALFKNNSRSFDLKHSALWCVRARCGPSTFFERQNWWWQAEPVSESPGPLSYCRDFPCVHLPLLTCSSLAFAT